MFTVNALNGSASVENPLTVPAYLPPNTVLMFFTLQDSGSIKIKLQKRQTLPFIVVTWAESCHVIFHFR